MATNLARKPIDFTTLDTTLPIVMPDWKEDDTERVEKTLGDYKTALENNEMVEIKVKAIDGNTGKGYVELVDGLEGIIEPDEVTYHPLTKQKRISQARRMIGRNNPAYVIKVDEEKNTIYFSTGKAAEDIAKVMWSKMEEGALVPATVVNVSRMTTFVELPGQLTGVIPIYMLTSVRMKNDKDIEDFFMKNGKHFKVVVEDFDRKQGRIVCNRKKMEQNHAASQYREGMEVIGRITQISQSGIMVRTDDGAMVRCIVPKRTVKKGQEVTINIHRIKEIRLYGHIVR